MDAAWRFRIMLVAAIALVMFGDFFGYGSVRGVKSAAERTARNFEETQREIEISDEADFEELSATAINQRKKSLLRAKLSEAIKESCLPKMLCEMAAKSESLLSEKEKDLLNLIRSSAMSFGLNSPPTRWHFAEQMGQLMKYTGDEFGGPAGCANLWPSCPISSKKLMKLSYKVNFK